ncbi:MAG: NUDIX domain-containing protein [Candidatus Paceibacterota bacterium]|jgi:8-oxo-dGTP pyrophosphatase MutT (NUDIX family)
MVKREFSAGIIIFRRTKEGPKFLLLYHGGPYWNFPKGKLEGETNFKAALREVQEETGIIESQLKFKSWFKVQDQFTYTRDRQRIFKVVTYYLAETKQQEVKIKIVPENHQGEKHEGYGWFLHNDASRLLLSPTLKQNLKKAYTAITHRKEIPGSRKPPLSSETTTKKST